MSYDYYGFPLDLIGPNAAATGAARQRCEARESQQHPKWQRLADKGLLPGDDALKKLIRKGVPAEFRPRVWIVISKAEERRAAWPPNYYESMASALHRKPVAMMIVVSLGMASSNYLSQIELDLPRTFPNNIWAPTAEAEAKLRRILAAFSVHAPSIGYCQGMNYLTAMLLMVLAKDESKAFWVLVALLGEKGILYPESFSSNLLGTHVEMAALAELLRQKLPQLADHLQKMQCDISIISTDYFLCLFCTTLPSETAMRVWDSLLYEGPKVLYRVALALLQENQAALLRIQDPGNVLRHMKAVAAAKHDRDALMEAAFNHVGSMPMKRIEQLRATKHLVLQKELRERQSKQNLRQAIQRGTSMTYVNSEGLAAEASRIKRERSHGHEWISNAVPAASTSSGLGAAQRTPSGREVVIEVRDVTQSARGQRAGSIVVPT